MSSAVASLAGTRPNIWAEKGKRIIDEASSILSGIGEVCSTLGISEAHFRRVFRLAYAENPEAYLQEVRIDQAKKLLLCDNFQVCGIGKMVGFKHRWSFERTFIKLTGICPTDYRRINEENSVAMAEISEKF